MRYLIFSLTVAALALAALPAKAQPCRGARASGTLTSAAPLNGPLQGLKITPNPWRSDRNGAQMMKFKAASGLKYVMIFTTSGRWVRTLHCLCAEVEKDWDLLNDAGQQVKSGIYIYLVRDVDGRQTRGTLAVLR